MAILKTISTRNCKIDEFTFESLDVQPKPKKLHIQILTC